MTSGIICVDANLVVLLLSKGMLELRVRELWKQWLDLNYTIVAPTLIHYEFSNALHRSTIAGQMLPEEAEQTLLAAMNLNITLYGDADLHREALMLARSLRLPATYDAHYLALAQRLECEFWTADRRLVNSVQATLPWVKLVSLDA
ncbi:type II toxin-antitoxin system VapC family toxin [Iningainema tapete]|uniref:Type II toxin-antitoxin system VapC family toxin n=1 Tax=Iningainema tapete BLCC-T55 TaxID=2748662 RepID=A0A8J6XUC2_9CYAN|nr:type II toxin-antitoxin system VapC family toxin [Iningainema tapete]MBD2776122.1 type II toxin-antitoxin system VapC family toxin [Iningainema tapete BLCC-T55]